MIYNTIYLSVRAEAITVEWWWSEELPLGVYWIHRTPNEREPMVCTHIHIAAHGAILLNNIVATRDNDNMIE